MKVKKISVPFYKWKVVYLIAESHEDCPEVLKYMKKFKMRTEDIENVADMFENRAVEGALCHYNTGKLITVIVVFPQPDNFSLVGVLIHESRHAVDKIIETTNLEGAESMAYLDEFVTLEAIKDYIKEKKYAIHSTKSRDNSSE